MARDEERGIFNNEATRENVWEGEGATFVAFYTRAGERWQARFVVEEGLWNVDDSFGWRMYDPTLGGWLGY